MDKKRQYKVNERSVGYSGFFRVDKLILSHELFAGGWSPPYQRELFVRGPAVGVLLYDPANDLVGLIEQFRVGAIGHKTGPWCLEIVAGIVEEGEHSEAVAHRELEEEAGVFPERLEFICEYLTSPGGSDETLSLYCAETDLSKSGGLFGLDEEHEDIRFVTMSAEKVLSNLYSGVINNATTIIALQWLALNRKR